MLTYVAFLRGINVGGHNKLNMKDLVQLFENLSFKNIKTYIQSGNVIFQSNSSNNTNYISQHIENEIYKHFNFQVPVIIRTIDDLQNIVNTKPFSNITTVSDLLYVTFLQNSANIELLDKINIEQYLPDKFKLINKEIFIDCVNYGTTKLTNNFFENKLKVAATTRNMNTINKIIELSLDISN